MKHHYPASTRSACIVAAWSLSLALGAPIQSAYAEQVEITNEAEDKSSELPLMELRAFAEVYSRIKQSYVDIIDDKVLLKNAIHGMLAGLDPYSAYLDGESLKNLKENTAGQFGGIGIEISTRDGLIEIIAPIEDTPAALAGLMAGDLISEINNEPVRNLTITEAIKLMRGRPGTLLHLSVLRANEAQPLSFDIKRAIIHIKSVKHQVLEGDYVWLRVSSFQDRTGLDLRRAIEKLKQNSDGGLDGIVLDLRNNPGGLLNSAVTVSDLFLDSGIIVSTEGRVKDSTLSFHAKPNDISDGAPIVVLINRGSASASEIVAGALQDHKRAVILGETSFGKGSVQTVLDLSTDSALKLTTANYYTPAGRSISSLGIKPDILVNPKSPATPPQSLPGLPASLASDYQLREALNLLKGLDIMRQQPVALLPEENADEN